MNLKENNCFQDLIGTLKEIVSKDKVIELKVKVKFNDRTEKKKILLQNQA